MIKFEWNAIKINIQDSDISNFVSSIRYFCQKNAKSFDNPISTHLSGYWRNYQRSFSFGLKNQSHGLWKSNGESTYLFSTVKVNVFDAIPSYSPSMWKNMLHSSRTYSRYQRKNVFNKSTNLLIFMVACWLLLYSFSF